MKKQNASIVIILIVRPGQSGAGGATARERTGGRRLSRAVQVAQLPDLQVQGSHGEVAGGKVLGQDGQVLTAPQEKLKGSIYMVSAKLQNPMEPNYPLHKKSSFFYIFIFQIFAELN